MNIKLTVAIPTYNFANYLGQTLDTIVTQFHFSEIELLILDGASTDATPLLVKKYQQFFPNIKYVRLDRRGGIDRDMARAVTNATGDYCWLFSGDDLMSPGALEKALEAIESGFDLYLTRHLEWVDDRSAWVEWPTLNVTDEPVFQLGNEAERHMYFSLAENTEAFFGFIGGLIVKKSTWESVSINEEFAEPHIERVILIAQYAPHVPRLETLHPKKVVNNF